MDGPVPCARCGVFIQSKKDTLYSDVGDPICAACRKALDEPGKRSARTAPLFWRALGAAFAGIIGFPIALFFFAGVLFGSAPAVASGWTTLSHLRNDPEARESLGARYGVAVVAAWVGITTGLLGVLVALANLWWHLTR